MSRSKLFLDYQRGFAAASGLAVVLREPEAKVLADWPEEAANPLCTRLAGTVNACAACREFQAKLASSAAVRGTPQTRQCHAGLAETMVPVRYGNRVFALLQIGQLRLHAASDDEIKRAVAEMTTASPSLDPQTLAKDLNASRAIDPARHAGLVQLLELFAHQLAEWFVRIGAAETPRPESTAVKTVIRIKEWLHANYHKPITLDQAARAVGLSRWYFSKVVHCGTGVTFRELVVEVRLERARYLLAHESMKITEVAAAVGFQSISQFNRTFRKANGQSAGEYRRAFAARQVNGHVVPSPSEQSAVRVNDQAVAQVA